jgi:steroid delta-isomerase-like uncharacterized protein
MSENKALARRWFEEVWNSGRAAAVDEMLAPTAVVRGLGADLVGPAAFKQFHAAYREAFPDVRLRVDAVVEENDVLAVRWSGQGTHQGNSLGFAATGMPCRFTGVTFMRVENGKFVEGWNVFDELGMLRQLGVTNLPPAP